MSLFGFRITPFQVTCVCFSMDLGDFFVIFLFFDSYVVVKYKVLFNFALLNLRFQCIIRFYASIQLCGEYPFRSNRYSGRSGAS